MLARQCCAHARRQRLARPGDLPAGGDSTQARRSRSVVSRSSTTSGPPPAGPEVISRRCRSTTAARSPARSPETCRTTYSVIVANATSSFTANSGSRLRTQAETRSSGIAPSSASPAASPATPALARIRTNGSESAEFRLQARPVRTSSPPDRYRLGSRRSVVMTPRTVRSSSPSPPSSRSPSASVSSSARSRMMSPPICLECCRWKSGRSSHPAFHTNLQDEEAVSQLLHGFGDCTRGTGGLCTGSTPR